MGDDEGDDAWTFDDEETRSDDREPVPEAVPTTASTGKYATLTGFEAAAAKEISGARDRLIGRDEVFVAFKLRLMSKRMHPEAAEAAVREFRRWFYENEELIAAAMKT